MSSARLCGIALAVLLLSLTPGVVGASPARSQVPPPTERCRVDDSRLSELSGLASDGRSWYAVNDGGSTLRVYVLDPRSCSVRSVRTAPTNPYDVEDLALAGDGAVWLADTGDNDRRRDSVAFHVMPARGGATTYRVAYPDGPHDAEALLLDRAGVPHIVTKEPFGRAGVYRPAGALAPDRTVPLEHVGSVALRMTDSPGGPVSGGIGSVLVTGGSVSRDGDVVALRTYTEAYVFAAPGGDVVAALGREPLRVPLANELQGEAIAWEPDGTLLSASEGQQPVRAVPGVANAVRGDAAFPSTQAPPADAPGGQAAPAEPAKPAGRQGPEERQQPTEPATAQALLLAGAAAAALLFLASRRRRRTR